MRVSQNVSLHWVAQGKFADMLPLFEGQHNQHSGRQAISFLHVDCNLYGSAMDVFKNLNDRIKRGTVIVFDELVNCEPLLHKGICLGSQFEFAHASASAAMDKCLLFRAANCLLGSIVEATKLFSYSYWRQSAVL